MSATKQMKVSLETWRRLKIQSAKEEIPMADVVSKAIEEYLRTPRARAYQHDGSGPAAPSNKKAMRIAQELKDTKQVGRIELEHLIGLHAGDDERTVSKYTRLLVREGVLVPMGTAGTKIWAVNHEGGWLPYHLDP